MVTHQLKAGVSKVNITPPVGIDLGGYTGRINPSQGIHDNLYAKALVLDNGERKIAIVTTDLVAWPFDCNRHMKFCGLIEKKTKINKENIMITASHTHSGPDRKDEDYISVLQKKIIGAVYVASQNMKKAQIGVGKGEVKGIGFNREGLGDIDTELGVIKVEDLDRNSIALFTNYACHGVVLGPKNLLISADYPGAMQEFIEKAEGGIAMFTQGACGDIDPLINSYAWGSGTFKDVKQVGTILGAEAVKVAGQIETTPQVDIEVKSKVIELFLQKLPSLDRAQEMVKKCKQDLNKLKSECSSMIGSETKKVLELNLRWAQKVLNLVESGKKEEEPVVTKIQLLSINDIILVGIPGEIFTEIGLSIKKNSGFKNTFIIGYANGYIGYIPPRKVFVKGGYGVGESFKRIGRPSPFTPDVGERVEKAIFDLMKSLK